MNKIKDFYKKMNELMNNNNYNVEEFYQRFKKQWSVEKDKKVSEVISDYFEESSGLNLLLKYSPNLKLKPNTRSLRLKETNFKSLIIKNIEKSLEEHILGIVHCRHFITSPFGLLKKLCKIQWVTKNRIKKVLMQLDQKFNFEEIYVKSRSNKKLKKITTKTLMFPLSVKGVKRASQNWQASFPEEYQHENRLFIQGGDSGIVFNKKGNYRTAFVEVFPKFIQNNDDSFFSAFVRGEGLNIKEAEKDAYKKLKKIKQCKNHFWERLANRNDGYAKCKKCNVRHIQFEPLSKCHVCNVSSNYAQDKNSNYFCLKHYYLLDENQAVDLNKEKTFLNDPEDELARFIVNKKIYALFPESFEEKSDFFWSRVSTLKVKYFPLFGKPLMTKEEFNKYILDNFQLILSIKN